MTGATSHACQLKENRRPRKWTGITPRAASLAAQLGLAGFTPQAIETEAAITFEKVGEGFEITASHLTVRARVPGADNARFQEIANKAKAGCPVSKALRARITMDASLQG